MRIFAKINLVFAREQILLPEDRLIFSDGNWHKTKSDEITFEAHCGINPEFCETPVFDSQAILEISALTAIYTSLSGASWIANFGWLSGHPCFQFWFGVECNGAARVIKLQFPDNALRGTIPLEISYLTSLIEINFHSSKNSHGNFISGVFPSVAAISGLRILDVAGNALTALPPDLWRNSNLELLDASNNRLTLLPDFLGRFTNLKILRLGNNLISDQFPEICNLQKIAVFNLANTALNGTLPSCVSSLNPVVFDISTSTTGISGEVPTSVVTTWTRISQGYLSIYGNLNMTGPIAAICKNFKHCYNSTYAPHADLTWVTQMGQVPQLVIDTINKAAIR